MDAKENEHWYCSKVAWPEDGTVVTIPRTLYNYFIGLCCLKHITLIMINTPNETDSKKCKSFPWHLRCILFHFNFNMLSPYVKALEM